MPLRKSKAPREIEREYARTTRPEVRQDEIEAREAWHLKLLRRLSKDDSYELTDDDRDAVRRSVRSVDLALD